MRSVTKFLVSTFVLLFLLPSPLVIAKPVVQDVGSDGAEYTVQPGDTLSQIAHDKLGDAKLWPQIIAATNTKAATDGSFVEIQNARLIHSGQKLWLPVQAPIQGRGSVDDPLAELLVPSAGDNGLYGYIDIHGNFVINPRFIIANEFREGFAVVSEDGLNFGYVDRGGEMIIPAIYKDAGYFSSGLAPVRTLEEVESIGSYTWSGYIDRGGELAFSERFLLAGPFVNGIAKAINEEFKTVYLEPSGNQVTPPARYSGNTDVTRRYIDDVLGTLPTSREGTCEAFSLAADHWRVWRCTVDEQVYDPCLLAADGKSLVCQYPLDPFTVVDPQVEFADVQIEYAVSTTPVIERFSLTLRGRGKECVRLFEEVQVGIHTASYRCDDGTYLIGDLRSLRDGRWLATQAQVAGDEPYLSLVDQQVVIIHRLTTLVDGTPEGESQGDIIPPYLQRTFYWRYQ